MLTILTAPLILGVAALVMGVAALVMGALIADALGVPALTPRTPPALTDLAAADAPGLVVMTGGSGSPATHSSPRILSSGLESQSRHDQVPCSASLM